MLASTLYVQCAKGRKAKLMITKQLRAILAQIEALKTPERSDEFRAGVDAAKGVISIAIQEAADRERIQQLEAELAALRQKYPGETQVAPKKRGRKPQSAAAQEEAMLEAE
jgi:ABC-type phosphate transport system auxiliary subunit